MPQHAIPDLSESELILLDRLKALRRDIAQARGVPAYVMPYANADEANHAPNENMEIDLFLKGIRTGAALLDRLGRG